ncbi:CAP domain-containing protein (plasmid) [Nicoliella spurrieriana]|uniref:CAP domain-containing protein n=1 Tax=Nicoliella spurrieriana TaxID=2925830 RepID=A0A976RR92_9LACO|nr:CAP domain-containing protein [Nicoliella spurrieriana]UQS86166.1 CAP domain-containing protein [Nicoliella spurrieriana]
MINKNITEPQRKRINNYNQIYNLNANLSNGNYQNGTTVIYDPSNTSVQHKHFPTNETDTKNSIHRINPGAVGKIIHRKVSNWRVIYYRVKFSGYKQALWIIAGSLKLPSELSANNRPDILIANDSINKSTGLQYINYIRSRHHLRPLKWNVHLATLAKLRNQQGYTDQKHFNHFTENGKWKVDLLCKQLHYNNHVLGENIAFAYAMNDTKTNLINAINLFTYDDSVGEHWGHRYNILRSDITQIGIAECTHKSRAYTAMEME